jgi:hypothetical protein
MKAASAPTRSAPVVVVPVQWATCSDVTESGVEILREPWSIAKHEHCPACGARGGVWMAGIKSKEQDETWRMCVACGTAYQFAVLPRAAGTGFLGVILEQLRGALSLRAPLALVK